MCNSYDFQTIGLSLHLLVANGFHRLLNHRIPIYHTQRAVCLGIHQKIQSELAAAGNGKTD